MTGSNAVVIVTPIVALVTLAFWLGLIFYVGSHPFWRGQRPPSREQPASRAEHPGTLPPSATHGLPGTAGPSPTAAGPQREAPR